MNSIYRFLLKGSNWILAGLLFILGFNVVSCGVEEEHSLRIIAEDIDGPENGSFKTDSIDVEVGDLKGGKSWYMGKAQVNAPDIKLKEDKEE